MNRVLLIDDDRALGRSVTMQCLDRGTAFRITDTLGEGLRILVDAPVSLILIDAGLIRLFPGEQARIFDVVAPGVPVVVLVKPNSPIEEHVRFEVHGFRVVAKPVDVAELAAKMEVALG
jgi:DNA-binding response OmpR family regulator